MIRNLFVNNWKTTSGGLTLILGSTVHLLFMVHAGTANENTWTIAIAAWITGLGLIMAGDAGAPPPPDTGLPPKTP